MGNSIKKKCAVLYYKGKPVALCYFKEVTTEQFLALEKECAENQAKLDKSQRDIVDGFVKEISNIKKDIKVLKGEEEVE